MNGLKQLLNKKSRLVIIAMRLHSSKQLNQSYLSNVLRV